MVFDPIGRCGLLKFRCNLPLAYLGVAICLNYIICPKRYKGTQAVNAPLIKVVLRKMIKGNGNY